MKIITLARRKPYQILVESVYCEEHYEKMKDTPAWRSDTQYEVKVRDSNSSKYEQQLECEECLEESQNHLFCR